MHGFKSLLLTAFTKREAPQIMDEEDEGQQSIALLGFRPFAGCKILSTLQISLLDARTVSLYLVGIPLLLEL